MVIEPVVRQVEVFVTTQAALTPAASPITQLPVIVLAAAFRQTAPPSVAIPPHLKNVEV